MTFDGSFAAEAAVGIFVAITIIGIVMAVKWKNRNFEGSPSKGSGWINRRKKKSDDTSD